MVNVLGNNACCTNYTGLDQQSNAKANKTLQFLHISKENQLMDGTRTEDSVNAANQKLIPLA